MASRDKVISVRELEVENTLLLYAGDRGIIKRIELERVSESETTYNFEVADFHTYYVGENGLLVHNKCVEPIGPENPLTGKPNSTALRWANNGKIYSATTYDEMGRQVARLDFYGSEHFVRGVGKIIPHVHTFSYWNGFMNSGKVLTLLQYMGGSL